MAAHVAEPAISVVIPFYRRHSNLERCLESLRLQDFRGFEVIVAAYRPDARLEHICGAHPFVRIAPVSGAKWNVSRSRNAGIESAAGELLIFLDADIAACPALFSSHLRLHLNRQTPCLSVGRVLGFSPYTDDEQDPASLHLLKALMPELTVRAESLLHQDLRWTFEGRFPFPWAFCWSGNLGIPRSHVQKHQLYFNESFEGWGGEDMEWAYRAYRTGVGIEFCRAAWGVHLPHERCVQEQISSEQKNLRRFIRLHPTFEVEMVVWLNDVGANRKYDKIAASIKEARGIKAEQDDLPVHLVVSKSRIKFGEELIEQGEHKMNLLGVATPFPDNSFEEVSFTPWIEKLPRYLLAAIQEEADRICLKRCP